MIRTMKNIHQISNRWRYTKNKSKSLSGETNATTGDNRKTHAELKTFTRTAIRRKLCIGCQPTVNRVVARKATDWSKFCRRCETGNSIGLYSVSECTRKLLLLNLIGWLLVTADLGYMLAWIPVGFSTSCVVDSLCLTMKWADAVQV